MFRAIEMALLRMLWCVSYRIAEHASQVQPVPRTETAFGAPVVPLQTSMSDPTTTPQTQLLRTS